MSEPSVEDLMLKAIDTLERDVRSLREWRAFVMGAWTLIVFVGGFASNRVITLLLGHAP